MAKSIKFLLTATISLLLSVNICANRLPFSGDISIKNAAAGGSFAPFINDSFSPFVNPAGLGFLEKQEVRIMYYNLFGGGLISAGAYALPLLEKGSFSGTLTHLSSGELYERDSCNMPTGRTFSDNYFSAALSYGYYFHPLVSAGINAKFYNHSFYNYDVSAYGADLGFIFILPHDIKLSAYIENIIKPVFNYPSGKNDISPLYLDLTAGREFRVLNSVSGSLKPAAGVSLTENTDEPGYHAGFDFTVYNTLSVKAGINRDGYAFGSSFKAYNMELNYSYVKKPLDFIHRFSLSYSFGDNIRKIEGKMRTKEEKVRYELVQKIRTEAVGKFKSRIKKYMKSGDFDKAKEAVSKALVWAPYNDWFLEKEKEINELINLSKKKRLLKESEQLMSGGQYIDAMVKLREILEIDPDNKTVEKSFERAKNLVETLGEKNLATQEKNRKSIKRHFEKGLNHYTSGNYERAVEEWGGVLKASPLHNQVYEYIQKAQSKIRKKQEQHEAVKLLKQQRISELYNKAVIQHTQGKFEESISTWKKLLKLDPGNTEAKEYLKKLTAEFKKIQKQRLMW